MDKGGMRERAGDEGASLVAETVSTTPDNVSFELRFRPCVELVSVVRRFISTFYVHVLADTDVTERLALATHELLENAVKYATHPETTLRIELVRSKREVHVRTSNRTERAHIVALERQFEEMHAEPDSLAYYQRLMHGTAGVPDCSGLGLARIRFEAEMTLALETAGDVVSIVALAKLEGPATT